MKTLMLAAKHIDSANEMPLTISVAEVRQLINYEKPLLQALTTLDWLHRPRIILALIHIARELQGKNLIPVSKREVRTVMEEALRQINWPTNEIFNDSDLLAGKFLEFIR
jgi:hypothetical protein